MRVAVLLSGGVDSAVALRLLQAQGLTLTAFYLKIWLEDERAFLGECPWEEDLRHARAVCAQAGVPLEVLSLQREYHEQIVQEAVAELRAGRTPSPDIWCNQRIKFGAFFNALKAQADGFTHIASGHYARVTATAAGFELRKGIDPVKDQTYFLFRLNQQQLSRCLFPVGGYCKSEVRQLARDFALPNQDRPDSQGICFLGKIRYPEFVKSYLGERPGEIRERGTGRRLGEHRGYWFYTLGQRHGLGLGGGPWYVVQKDVTANLIEVAHLEDWPARQARSFRVVDLHWIQPPTQDRPLTVKLRHAPAVHACWFLALDETAGAVTLAADDWGIAPGQAAVFYHDDLCLGGGTIADLDVERPVLDGEKRTAGEKGLQ